MAQADFSILPFGAGGISAAENSGTSFIAPRWYYGTSIPTGTFPTGYNLGDIVFNVNQTAGAPLCWVCTTAGTTSYVFSAVAASGDTIVSTVTATTGTLAPGTEGSSVILLNPATTGTYSLPEASGQNSGSQLAIKNIAIGPVTLTPLATDQLEGGSLAAVTLVQNQTLLLEATGTTNWYSRVNTVAPVLTTTATTGTLSNYQSLIILNPATTGTYSLPEALNSYPGFETTIKSIAVGPVTLSPLATDQYENGSLAAITLVANSAITLKANGSNWYNVVEPVYLGVNTQATAATGTLASGQRLIFLTGTGTYELPEAKTNYAGFALTILNKGGTCTLAPITGDAYQTSTSTNITLTALQSCTVITDGTTNWYKQSAAN